MEIIQRMIPLVGLFIFIMTTIITLIVYLYNRFKVININPITKTYSGDLEHLIVDNDLTSSYGRAEVCLQLNNNSKYNKSIGLKKLEYCVTNYKNIDFNNIILDYDIKSSKKIVGGTYGEINEFLLYAVNNSYNNSRDEICIEYYGDGILINDSFDSKIKLNMKPGEIKEILKVDFLDKKLVGLFKKSLWTDLYIKILFKGESDTFSVKFIDGAFQFRMGQFGAGAPPNKNNVQNLLISKNSSDYNTRIIKVPSNSQEQFTLNLFTPKSSKFLFTIYYNGKNIYTDQIEINVPIYDVRHLSQKILFFGQFSNFMIENDLRVFNLDERIYDTSKLNFYNYNNYFSKQFN
ncbi:hypothetical protein CW717_01665 [Macrococcoides caseolyticum]|uniref:hypothetical protein n=2 Tax=Macrococcoides caseolyticum TaxID=69966 RepID=UPI000C334234|nr:hypothetical protein [Macrococcus caseolyticus]PKD99723.1 hypothetical protein CW719_01665 [Macrococcus caseolyticus]PKF19811.1 hypothetical protein CW717_01665 [Macrococcus caseolyticus]